MATKNTNQKKKCPICGKEKSIAISFYKSTSPLYQDDKCVPICINCVKNGIVNEEDGTINRSKMKTMLQRLDKPLYWDDLDSAYNQYKKEHGYLSDDEVAKHGKDIIGFYFKNTMLRQNKNKSFADSEIDGHLHSNSNMTNAEKERITKKYVVGDNAVSANETTLISNDEPLIYSDKWMGNYSESDIKKLDHYYESLENDYNIVTENHRDYARKIAKASLQMDKTFDDMMNGVEGADKRYENATKAFDTLSKSAKFSESTRSVNDVGASSFSKVAAMVESHNWIPEHKPLKKDTIDEMIDYLSTITKSV